MNIDTKEKDIEARATASKRKGFDEFMKQPTIRLLISMIPAGEAKETLDTLLQQSFDTGWNHGSANIAVEMISGILDRPRRP